MADQFSTYITTVKDQTVMELRGRLDESAHLPKIEEKFNLRIQLKELKAVNSYGIKVWCQWVQQNSHVYSIALCECPFVFVKHFNTVQGLLTSNMTVLSFYVPFTSDQTDERKDVLLYRGTDFDQGTEVKLPVVYDSQGNQMELDVQPELYFGFLK